MPGPEPGPEPVLEPGLVHGRSAVVALRVIGVVGLLTLVGVGAASLVLGFFEQRSAQTSVVDGTVTAVDLHGDAGDVTIEAGPAGSRTTVRTVRRWTVRQPTQSRTLDAGTLRLASSCEVRVTLGRRCSVDWTVTVPADAAVTVSTSTGDIRVGDVSGQVVLRTGAGDIRLVAVRSTQVRVQTGVGDARLDFARAPDRVVTSTGAGDIAVQLPADGTAYRIVGSSRVGDRTVSVPEDPASRHVLDLSSGTGDVAVASGEVPSAGRR